jgi:formylglycine-generating enzyme required for sulfatase activity
MVLIPAGTNTGTDPDFGSYSLTLPAALYMDKYEVTKAKWDDVYNWAVAHGYSFDNAGSGKAVNHPVQTVSWYDCVKWCNARSQMESRIPAYYTSSSKSLVYKTGQIDIEDNCVNWSSGYRLPTVGEYQYAARGGASGKRFPWGDTIDHSMANYYGFLYDGQNFDMGYSGHDRQYSVNGLPFTSPVGSYENGKNGYGLYDTAGNVTEWCWDLIHINVGTLGEILGSGILRADHGGCWDNPAYDCRIGECRGDSPDGTSTLIGLRTVLPFIQ